MERRGTRSGFSVAGAFLFGSVFVGAGIAITLLGLRILVVDPFSVHAPYPIIVVCGLCFASGGLMVWGMAATQQKEESRARDAARRFGDSQALHDHAWDTRGYSPPRWGRAVQMVIAACLFSMFFSILNWWAWGLGAPWLVKIIAVLFDLLLVLIWWKALLEVARAIRFGGSRVAYDHFPYSIRDVVAVGWLPPRGLDRAERGSFTFRCVEEYYEERGSGKDRSRWLVHDELCAEVQSFDSPQMFASGRPVDLRFTPPPDALPTKLAADRPVFWELEVKLSRPGLDFEERYLIPVYAS
jgi:hypothetical protein